MKFIICMTVCLLTIVTIAYAQQSTPAAEKAFTQRFPTATNAKWEKESKNNYEVNFQVNGLNGSANFSATGEWLETEMEIDTATIPEAVINAFNKTYPTAVIKKAFHIAAAKGEQYYELEYSIKGKTKETKIDASGKLIKWKKS